MGYCNIMEKIMRNNVLNPSIKDSDESLRPVCLKDYIGQENMKKSLEVCIKSAKIRDTALDHMLFYGPPGLGKTTIARIIANEMGSQFTSITGPSIEKPGDLVAVISSLKENGVLFIDEIHRIPAFIEEILYPAMEDFELSIVIGNEHGGGKTIKLDLPRFTLIGATTKAGMLSAPLRDRFGLINRLEMYSNEELKLIIKRDAKILGIEITDEALSDISNRSRGTPRIAIRILKRLLDYAIINDSKNPVITHEIAENGFDGIAVNKDGLDKNDIRILEVIHDEFCDGPVGIETLSAIISEDTRTMEDVFEPYLMQHGYIAKTPRGRILTEKGINYIKEMRKDV